MTIVEVLKQAKLGQKIRWTEWSVGRTIEKAVDANSHSFLIWSDGNTERRYSNKYFPTTDELIGDKWEIVKKVQTWEGEVSSFSEGDIIFGARLGESPWPPYTKLKIKAEWEV